MLVTRDMSAVSGSRVIDSLRIQILGLLLVSLALPAMAPLIFNAPGALARQGTWISAAASIAAALVALFTYRRVTAFPGTRGFAYVLPSYSVAYGTAAAILLLLRLNYSGSLLFTGFVASILFGFLIAYLRQRGAMSRFYLVPFGNTGIVDRAPNHSWVMLDRPEVPLDPRAAIVADLRADHPPEWERMLAQAAISGRAVYHAKQLSESLTGKVEIEHLSENSFGSLLPNLAYRKLKRASDLAICVIALPLLAIPCAVIALLVKLDSTGPAFFRQERVGFRGRTFRVLKFRTMQVRVPGAHHATDRESAMTQTDDARVTRLGRTLRRTRLDELPQFWNVLLGEMSLIGPRPEAVALSHWYEQSLPFYVYRHIVRPGITGWAQVNQGHVVDLNDVHVKLHYDFFYIKNFSAWLDMLIALRTVAIMLTGFGSK